MLLLPVAAVEVWGHVLFWGTTMASSLLAARYGRSSHPTSSPLAKVGAGGGTSSCLELLRGSPPWISAREGGDGGARGEPPRWPEQASFVLGERHGRG